MVVPILEGGVGWGGEGGGGSQLFLPKYVRSKKTVIMYILYRPFAIIFSPDVWTQTRNFWKCAYLYFLLSTIHDKAQHVLLIHLLYYNPNSFRQLYDKLNTINVFSIERKKWLIVFDTHKVQCRKRCYLIKTCGWRQKNPRCKIYFVFFLILGQLFKENIHCLYIRNKDVFLFLYKGLIK